MGTLSKVDRQSPTLGQKPPPGAVVLFDGTNVEQWIGGRLAADHSLAAGTVSKQSFGDFSLHLEFRLPFSPTARGQQRGNSGVYLQNRYEIQVLDSFGLEGASNECGAVYRFRAPDVNMCFPPLAWQTYDIDFIAVCPVRRPSGTRPASARVTVKHNGVMIHDKRRDCRARRRRAFQRSILAPARCSCSGIWRRSPTATFGGSRNNRAGSSPRKIEFGSRSDEKQVAASNC